MLASLQDPVPNLAHLSAHTLATYSPSFGFAVHEETNHKENKFPIFFAAHDISVFSATSNFHDFCHLFAHCSNDTPKSSSNICKISNASTDNEGPWTTIRIGCGTLISNIHLLINILFLKEKTTRYAKWFSFSRF